MLFDLSLTNKNTLIDISETQLFSNMSTNLTKRNVSKTLRLMNPQMTNIVVDKSTWHAQPLSIGWLFSLDYIMVEISDVWFSKVYS